MRNLLLILFIVLVNGGCVTQKYVPFKPVYQKGDRLIISEEPVSAEFHNNIKIVFEFYDVPFKEDNTGAILIPNNVWQDQDTMWNYTTKANDPTWLKEHQ